jgi:hypothetical protein
MVLGVGDAPMFRLGISLGVPQILFKVNLVLLKVRGTMFRVPMMLVRVPVMLVRVLISAMVGVLETFRGGRIMAILVVEVEEVFKTGILELLVMVVSIVQLMLGGMALLISSSSSRPWRP